MAQVGDSGLLLNAGPASGSPGQHQPHVAAFRGIADFNDSTGNQGSLEFLGHFHAVLCPGTGSLTGHAFQLHGIRAQILQVGHVSAAAEALGGREGSGGIRRNHIALGIQEADIIDVQHGRSGTLGDAIVHHQADDHQGSGFSGEGLILQGEGSNLGIFLFHVDRPGTGSFAQAAIYKELHLAGAGKELAVGILGAHGHFHGSHIRGLLAQQADHVEGHIGNLAIVIGYLQGFAAVVVNDLQGRSGRVGHALIDSHKANVAILKVQAGSGFRSGGGDQRQNHHRSQNQSHQFVRFHFSFLLEC